MRTGTGTRAAVTAVVVVAALVGVSAAGAAHTGAVQLGHVHVTTELTGFVGHANQPLLYSANDWGNGIAGVSRGFGVGVYGAFERTAGSHPGVRGDSISSSTGATGVLGQVTSATPGPLAAGVRGVVTGPGNVRGGDFEAGPGGIGVRGRVAEGSLSLGGWFSAAGSPSYGVYATARGDNSVAVYGGAGPGTNSRAGYFDGNVHVQGTLSKSAGSFKIDHPLDPANRYLSHSFVESPEMLNVYNDNVTTDARGMATVRLPAYFQALNRDFRYQLTIVGSRGWNARVVREIASNRFTIQTDEPRVKVSWQVTGVRQDAYARAHPIVVEQDKPAAERGTFLHPEVHGQPAARGLAAKHTRKP
jgi:hypothetical protein